LAEPEPEALERRFGLFKGGVNILIRIELEKKLAWIFLVRPADFWAGYYFGPNIEKHAQASPKFKLFFFLRLFHFLDSIPNPKGKVASKQGDGTYPKKKQGGATETFLTKS